MIMQQTDFIQQVEIYKIKIPLIAPFITSLGRDDFAENIVIVIRTENGLTGFGECNPYMPINGESIDTCFAVAQYFGRALKGKNALDTEGCIALMDKIIFANYSIKSAFDIALHDIAARQVGLPLYRFLGGKKNKNLYTDYTVSLGDAGKMAEDAKKIVADGFPAVKVKLGESHSGDVARIRAIRKAIGKKIPVRIDANQGWDLDTAGKTLRDLEEYNIQFCEQPIPRWDYMGLKKLRKKSPIPIMADESCNTHHDARQLIEQKACDMMNVKLGKSGGLLVAGKIIRLAEKAGMPLQIGAFMESRLGMSAFAHLALSSSIVKFCDFDTALMYTEDPVIGGITYHAKGLIKVPDTPGLGACIDENWLKRSERVVL
jgi:L-alanine-DL-glutamate epimerase-like enolase superfamily enzyme